MADFDRCEIFIRKYDEDVYMDQEDAVAVEEPLEIRLGYDDDHGARQRKSISITMRTPGHDFELALGFLYTEGIISSFDQVDDIQACGPFSRLGVQNVTRVELKKQVPVNLARLERHFYTSSSCGVCGKTSIAALQVQSPFPKADDRTRLAVIATDSIYRLPELLRKHQSGFTHTGGLHASGLFSLHSQLLSVREDVGRHNALDKVIGHALLQRQLPLKDHILIVSGRASFELVQKAQMAGIAILIAVGAPSSLAVELAREHDMTLIGFVREKRMNIYHGAWRVGEQT